MALLAVALLPLGLGLDASGPVRDAALEPKADLYIAQYGAGSGSGKSCADARSSVFFNAESSWGPDAPIRPGTVVALCGTITSTLIARGSGSAGKPITIVFAPHARLSQPVCNCLDLSNQSYIVVNGGGSGIVESTDNGTDLGHQENATAILANPCNHCEIENLTIQNVYVHAGRGSEIDQTQMRAIYFSGSDFRFYHNVVHDAGWAIFNNSNPGDTDIRVDDNDIYHVDHGFIQSGGDVGDIWFDHNHVHDFANWDTDDNAYHHDGIHCYTVAGGTGKHIDNFYVYDNRFDGSVGSNATAWIFDEGAPRGDAYDTPCSDATSNFWVFNNFAHTDVNLPNGVFNLSTGKNYVFHNTLVGNNASAEPNPQIVLAAGGAGGQLKNNVLATGNQVPSFDPATFSGGRDYNLYANSGDNWYCGGFLGTFAAWRSCMGDDAHSMYRNSAELDAEGVPAAGSPVLGAGTSLSALCKGNLIALCSDARGALRPSRMAPDIGAFQRETAAISAAAIGNVRIGSGRRSVELFYGQRPLRPSRAQLLGFLTLKGVTSASYRLHGGRLVVSYVAARVVAAATTSLYYETWQGFGVGAEGHLPGEGWTVCGKAFVRRRGGLTMAVRLSQRRVAAVAVARSAVVNCP